MKTIYHPAYVTLIDHLIEIRRQRSLTQAQLAEQFGKHQSYVAKVEGCERKLDILELVEWCAVLGISASECVRDVERAML